MEILNSSRLVSFHRAQTSRLQKSSCFVHRINFLNISEYKYLQSSRVSINYLSARNINMGLVLGALSNVQSAEAPDPPASGKPSKSWRSWVVGVLLSIVLPFAHNKWGRLLTIKNDIETAVKTVETVVEVVEKVAEEVAKVADEVADQLPEGGKLKGVVCFVENVAKETAKDAHIADQLIEKVEAVEKEMGSVIVGKIQEIAKEVTRDEDFKAEISNDSCK